MAHKTSIERTFFDAIGTADMERVHSAVIGWILSDDCQAYNMAEKSTIIYEMFGVKSNRNFRDIRSCLEYNHMDIYVVTDETTRDEQIWVIENKVKSSQGKDQLGRYFKEFGSRKSHGLLLSLIDEAPAHNMWKANTYSSLYAILEKLPMSGNSESHKVIVKEYVKTIRNLTSTVDNFINNPASYPNVFMDAHKKKAEKESCIADYNDNERYISNNNLETVLQKLYLSKIKRCIEGSFEGYKFTIGETHGTALLNFELSEGVDLNKRRFELQFQGGTFKFAVILDNYSKISDEKLKDMNETWGPIFAKLKGGDAKYERLCLGKSHSRVAVSKQMRFGDGKEWWNRPLKDVAGALELEFATLPDLIDKVNII